MRGPSHLAPRTPHLIPMTQRTIITHAQVYTANPDQPHAQAVVVEGNKIVFVGSNSDAQAYHTSGSQHVHGRGQTLMPGFIDSHFHLLWGALGLGEIDLESVRSLDALRQTIHAALHDHANMPWVVGCGLRYSVPSASEPLTRHHLDAIVSDRPFIITAYDYHTMWANTAALQLADILHGGETGPNSVIVLDKAGQATGELREPGAYNQLLAHQPTPSDAAQRALLQQGLALCASLGITSVHNMDGNMAQAQQYAALADAGELTLRVYLPYDITPETPFDALATEAIALRDAFPRDEQGALVRAGFVKFFMDGVLESYTAALLAPYADRSETSGDFLFSAAQFNEMATEADRLGLQIAVHCCGDAAVRRTLDGYAVAQRRNGRRDSRHRVEHIELIHVDDVPRFAELGVLAAMQPLHAPLMHLDDSDVWPSRAGENRWANSFAWRTLQEAGAQMPFGSDWPVVSPNPLAGLFAAQNREPWGSEGDEHFRLDRTAVLANYTRVAAYAEFQEGHKGQIRPGYLADLVLLSADLLAVPATELGEVTAVWTMCDGRVVFER